MRNDVLARLALTQPLALLLQCRGNHAERRISHSDRLGAQPRHEGHGSAACFEMEAVAAVNRTANGRR
jgi:hypothetical protein